MRSGDRGVVGNFFDLAGDHRPQATRDLPETGFLMNGMIGGVQ